MKKFVLLLFLFILFFSSAIPTGRPALAQDFSELTKQIQQLEQQLLEAQTREKTLTSQVAYMNNQIKLTTLKIDETQRKISQLIKEIDSLSQKIDRLEESLDQLSKVLLARIVETYKRGNASSFQLLFSSGGFSEFLTRLKYIRIVQTHDKKLLLEMQLTKSDYSDQKQVREAKKLEQENLRRQLVDQTNQLARQKKEKETLLEVTRNDEKKYQQQLAQAYAEKAALEQALVAGTKVGPIKKGDAIALVGNTGYPGCSTGKHLHFEIRKNNGWTDPMAYLQNKTVEDDQNNGGNVNVGNGSWPWPINDPIRITQFFGQTPYSWRYKYSGGVHTGLDMITSSSDVIKAPADGTLFKSSQLCGSSVINIVYIDHGDSLISFYLHVQ